jgi:hypothetical protein
MMASIPSVIEQQTRWAVSKGLTPKNAYLRSVSENLLADLSEGARKDFERGSGGELRKRGLRPPKMLALRSSAALTTNVFDYWRSHDAVPLQNALGLSNKITSIGFEEHFPTGLRGNPPNVDVVLTLEGGKYVAIEAKFTEWLNARDRILDPKYFSSGEIWTAQGLPNCQAVANDFKETGPFHFLDVPQLLKHALGVARKKAGAFALYYLYYDVRGAERERHADEVTRFRDLVGREIGFVALTYQELFGRLESTIGPNDSAYLDYLRARYPGTN